MMFSSTSFAEWTKVGENVSGSAFYLDFERIRKVDGFVYFWYMQNYLKPDKFGDFSAKMYLQGDCKIFRVKYLSFSYHKEPMGRGTGEVNASQSKEWTFPTPDSVIEEILKKSCSR
jgi:hypothetical protein